MQGGPSVACAASGGWWRGPAALELALPPTPPPPPFGRSPSPAFAGEDNIIPRPRVRPRRSCAAWPTVRPRQEYCPPRSTRSRTTGALGVVLHEVTVHLDLVEQHLLLGSPAFAGEDNIIPRPRVRSRRSCAAWPTVRPRQEYCPPRSTRSRIAATGRADRDR